MHLLAFEVKVQEIFFDLPTTEHQLKPVIQAEFEKLGDQTRSVIIQELDEVDVSLEDAIELGIKPGLSVRAGIDQIIINLIYQHMFDVCEDDSLHAAEGI